MRHENIIIDLNNLFWRQVSVAIKAKLDNECDNFYSHSIERSLNRIKTLVDQYGYTSTKVYILHDNPFSKINERKEIFPSYKHARQSKQISPVFYKSLEQLIQILKSYNDSYYIVGVDNCEADDLVPSVLKVIKGNGLLVSADLDWARGISESISWFNYTELYTIESFKNKYGYSPFGNSIKMYKALHGDDSDCIPNAVPYLPKEILLDIVGKYNSVNELFSNIKDENYSSKIKIKLKEAENQIRINYQLVDYLNVEVVLSDIIFKCKEDIKDLRFLFKQLQIPFEGRMIDKEADKKIFFQKPQVKRVTKF